eukprot:gene8469-biopygen6124
MVRGWQGSLRGDSRPKNVGAACTGRRTNSENCCQVGGALAHTPWRSKQSETIERASGTRPFLQNHWTCPGRVFKFNGVGRARGRSSHSSMMASPPPLAAGAAAAAA